MLIFHFPCFNFFLFLTSMKDTKSSSIKLFIEWIKTSAFCTVFCTLWKFVVKIKKNWNNYYKTDEFFVRVCLSIVHGNMKDFQEYWQFFQLKLKREKKVHLWMSWKKKKGNGKREEKIFLCRYFMNIFCAFSLCRQV